MARGKGKATLPRSLEIFVDEQFSNGIGHKKREIQKANGGYSPYVHSYSSINRYSGIVKGFVKYMKMTFPDVNRIDMVKKEHLEAYLNFKIDKNISEKTMKINLSALKKYFLAFDRKDLVEYIDNNYQNYYSKCLASKQCEPIPFYRLEQVIERISQKNELFGCMARLQYNTGARLGDIKKLAYDKTNNTITIYGSKGGKTRTINYSDRKEIFDRIVEDIKKVRDAFMYPDKYGYKDASSIREQYAECVSNTTQKVLEERFTSHSFRYNYAVNRSDELPEEERDRIITRELGHNRIEMSCYYYKKFK